MDPDQPVTDIVRMLLEDLYKKSDFVDITPAILALQLKNDYLNRLLINTLQGAIDDGFLTAKDGSKIKITQKGRDLVEALGPMTEAEKAKWR